VGLAGWQPKGAHRTLALSRIDYKRPYLAIVRKTGIEAVPIHEQLLPMKEKGKRDPELQARLVQVVTDGLSRLQTTFSERATPGTAGDAV